MFSVWSRPRYVAVLLLGYLLLHFALRLWMNPTLGMDDAEQALFAQHWLWSYRFRAPPLFTWLLMPLSTVTGMNILALSILRYVLLGVCFWFTYLTTLRLIEDRRLAALSLFSFASIYVFAYYSHHDLTHTTMMATMIAVSWYVFVRLCAAPSWGWYALFGLCIGLGMLGKWNFVILPAALFLACLMMPRYRHLVLTPKVLATGIMAGLVILPSVLWLLQIGPAAGDAVDDVLGTATNQAWWQVLLAGTSDLALAIISYPQPFLLLFLLCFAAALWRGAQAHTVNTAADRPDVALIGWTIAIALALHWLLIPITGATEFAERWMQPALMVLPVFLFMVLERGQPSARAIQIFAALMAAMVLVVLAARIVTYVRGADHCGSCRALVPFEELTDQLRQAGYNGEGTIIVGDFHVGGNLRVQFPQAHIMYHGYPEFMWPQAKGNGPCLLVWRKNEHKNATENAPLLGYLEQELGGKIDMPHQQSEVAALMQGSKTRNYVLGYRLYDGPNGECR